MGPPNTDRAIDSVTLKAKQKSDILLDIKNFLDPATEDMYNTRGIPHRRDYLFHDPLGIGKTR